MKYRKSPMAVKGLPLAHLNRENWDGCEWCCNEVMFDSGDMSLELFHPLKDDDPQVVYPNYCPMCGRPLNEEGWIELERKVGVEAHTVVKGRFVHDGPRFAGGVDWWHCSNCGSLVSGVETRFAFCRSCGADMREEKP